MVLLGMKFGIKIIIVMLCIMLDIKVEVVCGFGGEVLLYGSNFDEVKVEVECLFKE